MKKISNSGQTLIEVMVALFALTAGFLGITALLSQSLYLTKTISNQTTATYLAAEGIELAKNIIDHDVYQNLAGFGTGWGTAFGPGGDFQVDYTTCTLLTSPVAPCRPLAYVAGAQLGMDAATHGYSYAGSIPTGFTRKISVNNVSSKEIAVTVTVAWTAGGAPQNVVLEDHFYNWK